MTSPAQRRIRSTSTPRALTTPQRLRSPEWKPKFGRFPRFTVKTTLRVCIVVVITFVIVLNLFAHQNYSGGSSASRQLRSLQVKTLFPDHEHLPEEFNPDEELQDTPKDEWPENRIHVPEEKRTNDMGVAWLMSYPNSGTSFTLHMAREASNCTTATNYALEGEIKDKPSIQAIPGPEGENGPFLELIPGRYTDMPQGTILTKTHCHGFCTDPNCWIIHTVRSFMMGCLSGFRAVEGEKGIEKVRVTYNASLVTKAIHLFRHPLDNVVARFHLDYNVKKAKGDTEFAAKFPQTALGFQKWCATEDRKRELFKEKFVDKSLRQMMVKVPCFNEFFRYIQWHNLAFSVTYDMDLPTMILHYEEYAENFEKARDRVLSFVGLPLAGTGVQFEPGKIYHDYYTTEQKQLIRAFLKEFASAETWHEIKDYDFEEKADASLQMATA